jgi:hypothetical protein
VPAFLTLRTRCCGGGVNNTTTGPIVDGDSAMAYTGRSARRQARDRQQHGRVVDYVGNAGATTPRHRHQRSPVMRRPRDAPRRGGVRPDGHAVPRCAKHDVRQFNLEQTRELGDALNSDFNSLELELEKANGQSLVGTCQLYVRGLPRCREYRCRQQPASGLRRCDRDNTHAFATSANVDLTHGFVAGMVFRTYSGYPNQRDDRRRQQWRRDVERSSAERRERSGALPICRGRFARLRGRNGDRRRAQDDSRRRFQYVASAWDGYQAGFFLEVYNLTNHANFGNPTGARNSANFMKNDCHGQPRTAQLGFRLLF